MYIIFPTETRPEQEGDRRAGTEALERDQHRYDGAATATNHQNRNPQDGHIHHQQGGTRCKYNSNIYEVSCRIKMN